MKTTGRVCAMALIAILVLGLAGCCVYSQQKYGAVGNVMVSPGRTTIEEVVKQVGAPSFVDKTGGKNLYCFSGIDSFQILGVYASVKKIDLVVIADNNGLITSSQTVNSGEGMSILGGFMLPTFETE